MTQWITKINIYDITQREGDETPDEVLNIAKAIKEEIGKNLIASTRLGALGNSLVQKTQKAIDAGFDYESTCDVFNGALEKIYDRANLERIWTAG